MKTRGNQVVMPLNVAKMIEKSDQVFKMAEIWTDWTIVSSVRHTGGIGEASLRR